MLFKSLCLMLLSAFLVHLSTQSPMIVDGLSNMTVPVGSQPISMTCRVEAYDLHWRIDGALFNQNTMRELEDRGFRFSQRMYIGDDVHVVVGMVTVNISPEKNNNTVIECRGTAEFGRDIAISTATLLIADVPLPPSPVFMGIDGGTIGLEWEVPFTWEDFPILGYTLEVVNQTNSTVLDTTTMTPDILSYNLTRNDSETSSCTTILFSLQATSDVGSSAPGITYGAFPTAPGPFVDNPSIVVTFTTLGTPYLDISFTFPLLCPYVNANYYFFIEDDLGKEVYRDGPHPMHWNGSSTNITLEVREGELQMNMEYMAVITVSTTAGQSDTQLRFNTSFASPTPPDTESIGAGPSRVPYLVIGVSSGVTGLVVLGIIVVILFIGLGIRKKQCRRRPEQVDVMVPNPLYGDGVIYEEIPCQNVHFNALPRHVHEREEGYVSITPSGKITSCPLPSPPLDGCPCKEGLEDTYTVMNPAGTRANQDGGVVSPYYLKNEDC